MQFLAAKTSLFRGWQGMPVIKHLHPVLADFPYDIPIMMCIKNRTNYDINVEYCFALKTLIVSSTQKVSFVNSGYYLLDSSREWLYYQIDSLFLPWGLTSSPSYINAAANIILPETITKVNLGTRQDDKAKIKTITCKAIVPPSTGTASMDCVSEDAVLHVPSQSVDLYKAADDWKTIKTILPIEE